MSTVYINLYKQGYYHRAGKPSTVNIHPGDMYASREAAIADIDTDAPYVGTVPVLLGVIPFEVYPEMSDPTPLRESRKWFANSTTQDMIEWDASTPGNLPITHNVGETFTAEPSQIAGMRPLLRVEQTLFGPETAFEMRYAAVNEDDNDARYDYPPAAPLDTGDDYSGPSYEQWKARLTLRTAQ